MRHLLALAALAACAPMLKAPDDRRAVDGGALDQLAVDQAEVDQLAVDQAEVDQLAVDGGALDQLAVDQLAVDQLAVDQLAVDGGALDVPPTCGVDLECTLPYRGPSAGILARCVGARCVVLCLPGLAWCDFGMRHRCTGGLCQ